MTVSRDGVPGTEQLDVGSIAGNKHSMLGSVSLEEQRKIGKVYAKDAPLDSVVAAELSRIQKAFD